MRNSDSIEERVLALAEYIIESKDTVRGAAKRFGVSKSTVHKDITQRLMEIDPILGSSVRKILDEKGGEIKSEAAIDMIAGTSVGSKPKEDEPRYFYVDDTFAIFLREKGKTKPYFAGRIDDITKFQ